MASNDALRVVLDTNVILSSVSGRSPYKTILDDLLAGKYELLVTNDILLEYEEKLIEIFDREVAELLLGALAFLPNVKKVEAHFQLQLIPQDVDDNKFVDCAFAGNAHYLVSNDKHYNVLKRIDFPLINIIKIEEFKVLLQK